MSSRTLCLKSQELLDEQNTGTNPKSYNVSKMLLCWMGMFILMMLGLAVGSLKRSRRLAELADWPFSQKLPFVIIIIKWQTLVFKTDLLANEIMD